MVLSSAGSGDELSAIFLITNSDSSISMGGNDFIIQGYISPDEIIDRNDTLLKGNALAHQSLSSTNENVYSGEIPHFPIKGLGKVYFGICVEGITNCSQGFPLDVMPKNIFNLKDADNNDSVLEGVQSLILAEKDDKRFLIATAYGEDGVSVFEVMNNGNLVNVFNLTNSLTNSQDYLLDGAFSSSFFHYANQIYVAVAASIDDGISIFNLTSEGKLVSVTNIKDGGNLNLDSVRGITAFQISNQQYIFASGYSDDGISGFKLEVDGTFTNHINFDDSDEVSLDRVEVIKHFTLEEKNFLMVSGEMDKGITVFEVMGDGSLRLKENIKNDDVSYEIDQIRGIEFFKISDDTLIVYQSDYRADKINVFSQEAGEDLLYLTNVADSQNIKLDGVWGMEIVELGNAMNYLFSASRLDDTINIFKINSSENLVYFNNIEDNTQINLNGVSDLVAGEFMHQGLKKFYLFSAGNVDDGISVFQIVVP